MALWLSQARAEARNLPPSLLFPWERGFLGVVFGTRLPLEPFGYHGVEVPVRMEPALARAPPPVANTLAADKHRRRGLRPS